MPYPSLCHSAETGLGLSSGCLVELAWATGFYPSGSFPCRDVRGRVKSVSSLGECQPSTPPSHSLPAPSHSLLLTTSLLNQHFNLFPWKAQALEGL